MNDEKIEPLFLVWDDDILFTEILLRMNLTGFQQALTEFLP